MHAFALTLAVFALGTSTVSAVAWVAGYQSSGYTGLYIGQYNDLYVGNPRRVAYLFGSSETTPIGDICSGGTWVEWAAIGNGNPGQFDFNCRESKQDINDNYGKNGFYVGGLNHNGVTVAQCYMTKPGVDLCDSDTISNKNAYDCTVVIECE